jgi:hypothetical protein
MIDAEVLLTAGRREGALLTRRSSDSSHVGVVRHG